MKSAVFDIHAAIEDTHWWFEGRRRIVYPLVDVLMAERDGGSIIDVGCGTGGTVAPLARRYKALGIDAAVEAIESARRRYPWCTFRVGAVPKDIADVTNRATIYLMMDVLEHVEDDRALLADLVSVTKPGAHILVTVPADMALWSPHDVAVGHRRRYSTESFSALWRGLPVSLRLISHINARLYWPIRLARWGARMLGRGVGRDGTDLDLPPALINRVLLAIFAGESGRIRRLFRGQRRAGYSSGVSLLAILKREETPA